jgi:hypothetical protein
MCSSASVERNYGTKCRATTRTAEFQSLNASQGAPWLSLSLTFLAMDARLERFLDHFNQLEAGKMKLLTLMYTEDISFQDPMHEIHGLSELTRYFDRLYKNTLSCRFEWDSRLMLGNEAMLTWRMGLTHKHLNRGREFWLPGATHLRFRQGSDLVCMHRDYFDVSDLIYERIPAVGPAVRWIKSQL